MSATHNNTAFSQILSNIAFRVGGQPDDEELLVALRKFGADEADHANDRTLHEHLSGTFNVLKAWRLKRSVCVAGLFHSVYSTPAYRRALLSQEKDRARLIALIGTESERLVSIFSEVSFAVAIDTLLAYACETEPVKIDRTKSGTSLYVSLDELIDLSYIHAANLAEQSSGEAQRPGFWVARVARAMLAIQRVQPLPNTLLEAIADKVIPQAETRCRRAYDRALECLVTQPFKAQKLFLESSGLECNAEPLFYTSAIALAAGDLVASKRYAEQALHRLMIFGTPWDKRKSRSAWEIAITGLQAGQMPTDFPAVKLDSVISPTPPPLKTGLARFQEFMDSFARGLVPVRAAGFYPNINQRRFYDKTRFQVVEELERHYSQIRTEIEGLDLATFHQEGEPIQRTGSWDVFMFYERGRKIVDHCDRCPTIQRIIESSECMRTLSGLIYVSRLGPGTLVGSHFGPTNMRLRCHLGIKIPSRGCGLEVGGQVAQWSEGQCTIFDDSFEHSVWNLSESERIVLIVDLWHIDLHSEEIEMLKGLQQYASVVSPGLVRYWNMNQSSRNKRRSEYD